MEKGNDRTETDRHPVLGVVRMTTAVGYVRVSTASQAEEGVSLEAQRQKIEAWCLVHDIELAEVFVDAGLSGSKAHNRPGLQNALESVKRTGGVLVVYSLSRLARSTRDTITISDELDRHGCDLASISEKIDTTSAAGKMVFRMLAVMAEFERDQVSERTRVALAHMKSQGLRVGRVPFGHDLAEDGETLLENTREQAVIDQMKALRQKGLSYAKIAGELNTKDIRTKEGSQWQAMTASRILKRVG